MDTLTLSSRCISDYEVLQDQRQLPIALGWSLHSHEDGRSQPRLRKSGGIMDQTQAIWIRDPLSILADGAERGLVVSGGKIVELVPRGREPVTANAVVYDAGSHVVLPGLINTHHHFYQTLTRALPAGLEDALDIEVAAAQRLGIRVLLTRGSMNRSQKDGGLPPDSVVQDEDTILADSERVVGKFHQRGEDAMVQIALAPCSPFSVTTSLMRATADLAEKLDVRLHTHLAETEDENKFCEQMHDCRPLDYLEQCGWLNARTWLAHGIFFNAEEMKRLGKARTAISHCACSNQILASGCCPVCEMEEAGVSIGLGVDGSASNDESNLMQEVRAAFLLQRARYGVTKVSHKDALRWATKGSAACVGRPELGEIAVGKAADLALFKLDDLRFSGHGDPLAAVVLCGAHRADRVMVGGKWVVADGAIPGLDVPDLIRRHSAAARAMH